MAVLAVVVGHSRTGNFGSAGTVGVTFFFVLSGFLITRLLVEEHKMTGRIDLSTFVIRRARRLAPALLFFLAVGMIPLSLALDRQFGPIVAAALYASNVLGAAGFELDLLRHTWSLALEEQFYLLWPTALWVLLTKQQRLIFPLLSIGIAAITVWRFALVVAGASPDRIVLSPDTRADALLVGCLLALCVGRLGTLVTRPSLFCATLAMAAGCASQSVESSSWMLIPVSAASALIVLWAATKSGGQGWASLVLESAVLRGIGRISYGVYLWHYPVAVLLGYLLPTWSTAVLTLMVTLPIAFLSWRCIEQPFLRPMASQRPATGTVH